MRRNNAATWTTKASFESNSSDEGTLGATAGHLQTRGKCAAVVRSDSMFIAVSARRIWLSGDSDYGSRIADGTTPPKER